MMKTPKEWYSTKELLGVAGLPKSRQGVNRRAREGNWQKRKRAGVQGKGVEYAFSSLPETVRDSLTEQPASYQLAAQDPMATWMAAYQQLSQIEKDKLLTFILRHGMTKLLQILETQPDED